MAPLAIPYFQLLKGAPNWQREPRVLNFVAPFGGTFSEFYCQSGGSNLNSGHTRDNAAIYTSTNGNWSTTTNQFIPTDGTNPAAAGVMVGGVVSIFLDAASVGVFIARVTDVQNQVNGAITVSASVRTGSPPSTGATGRTLKFGGAWRGPNGSSAFPFGTLTLGTTMQNFNNDWVRVNMKNDVTYSTTAAITLGSTNYILQGYSNDPGDGGKATFDFGNANTSALSTSSQGIYFIDLIIKNTSSASSGNVGISMSGQLSYAIRCIALNLGGSGFQSSNTQNNFIECEAYNCNLSKNSAHGGFALTSQASMFNCYSHENYNAGIYMGSSIGGPLMFSNCISESNYGPGFMGAPSNQIITFMQCDFYNNQGEGILNTNTSNTVNTWWISNCNFIKNLRKGIDSTLVNTGRWYGYIKNCGFGNGSMANKGGDFGRLDNLLVVNKIVYPADTTPWNSPDTGDFRITSAYAINAGYGSFQEGATGSKTGTVGYPDIGAAQAVAESGSGYVGGG